MFYLDLVHGQYGGINLDLLPVFNLADAAIGVGIFAIIILQRRLFKHWQEHQDGETVVMEEGQKAEASGEMEEQA
jgi:lipoprotein signal peptidase